MSQTTCFACGAEVSPKDETCPACGELTDLGWRRDDQHRREFESKGSISGKMVWGALVVSILAMALLVVLANGL